MSVEKLKAPEVVETFETEPETVEIQVAAPAPILAEEAPLNVPYFPRRRGSKGKKPSKLNRPQLAARHGKRFHSQDQGVHFGPRQRQLKFC